MPVQVQRATGQAQETGFLNLNTEPFGWRDSRGYKILEDFSRKSISRCPFAILCLDKLTSTGNLGKMGFRSDLVLDTNRIHLSFQVCSWKMQHDVLHGSEKPPARDPEAFLTAAVPARRGIPCCDPKFQWRSRYQELLIPGQGRTGKHPWNRSFSVIQVRVNSEVTIPQLSSLSDSQRLPRLQQRRVQHQGCP